MIDKSINKAALHQYKSRVSRETHAEQLSVCSVHTFLHARTCVFEVAFLRFCLSSGAGRPAGVSEQR